MKNQIDALPNELKSLVKKSVHLLGEVIREEGGVKLYNKVECIRKEMVAYRSDSVQSKRKRLDDLYKKLSVTGREEQHQVATAFSLMLELINFCESAYRTYRLSENKSLSGLPRQKNSLVYVLTAHPTEARTSANIELFRRIQQVAVRVLEHSREEEYLFSIIKHNLKLAWLLPVTRHTKPQVVDEARHLFSVVLRPDIFDTIIRANRDLGTVRVRTWVGGDKDGHPGVDEKVMLACLQASRDQFVVIVKGILGSLQADIDFIDNSDLMNKLKVLRQVLGDLKRLKKSDALRVKAFRDALDQFDKSYMKVVGAQSPRLRKLKSVLDLFPGLVVSIELREDSEVIAGALEASKPIAIERMLSCLKDLSEGGSIRCYAEGMIISMCESYSDVENTIKLVKRVFGQVALPVIPLFETSAALDDAVEIVSAILANKQYKGLVKSKFNNHLEIMLGYSDSSKGMGVLASRLMIAKTMRALDALITKSGVVPVFFHGSGGSISRGGGSIEEQTAWWPKSALNLYKATIQGEMVERTFSSPEVSLSGMNRILTGLESVRSPKRLIKIDKEIEEFSALVSKGYGDKIAEDDFFQMVEAATPYSYLNVLKLGSRPSKRSTKAHLDLNSLRAIPWVLCWTQTRTLFPTWWGVGSAWRQYKASRVRAESLQKAWDESNLLKSFVRILGFTLSKVDLQIFRLYLSKSELSKVEQEKIYTDFETEFKLACQFVQQMTGEKNLLWFKPWLKDSINFRSSMIHPLNILQILGNKEGDEALVRKTVAGISSGMMSTG